MLGKNPECWDTNPVVCVDLNLIHEGHICFSLLIPASCPQKLESAGAKKQRLLWASTGTKNPNYSDVLYVEELLGKDTVNTVPPSTLDAFRDHGIPEETLTKNIKQSEKYLKDLENIGVSLDEITHQLQLDGVDAFINSFTTLMEVVSQKQSTILEKLK